MPLSADELLATGTLLAGYRIERELGRGNMAIVYLANQLNLERLVALKVLTHELAEDEEYVVRFFNEARAAAQLTHANIVQAYDAGVAEGEICYFAMEYVEGENLDRRLAREGVLSPQVALPITIDIASALDYGWRKQRLTHGDIKPENTLISTEGITKLADFGLAKVVGQDFAGESLMLTPLYAAPEVIQAEHEPGDCRADIYSLGATLYHLLCGRPPFQGDPETVMQKQIAQIPEPLIERNSLIEKDLSEYVAMLLDKSPAQRPDTWGAVVEDLRRLAHTAPKSTRARKQSGNGKRSGKIMPPRRSPAGAGNTPSVSSVLVPRIGSASGALTFGIIMVAAMIVGLLIWRLGGARNSRPMMPPPGSVPVEPARTTGTQNSTPGKERAAADWERLKARLPSIENPQWKLNHLEAFERRHGYDTPAEVYEVMREVRKQVRVSQGGGATDR